LRHEDCLKACLNGALFGTIIGVKIQIDERQRILMACICSWSLFAFALSLRGLCRSLLPIVLCISILLCGGCSTWSKLNKTEQGAILGTGAGAAIGGASGGSTGVIVGGAAGGLAGGLIGHELEKHPERKDEEEEQD
jgi:surface antigen